MRCILVHAHDIDHRTDVDQIEDTGIGDGDRYQPGIGVLLGNGMNPGVGKELSRADRPAQGGTDGDARVIDGIGRGEMCGGLAGSQILGRQYVTGGKSRAEDDNGAGGGAVLDREEAGEKHQGECGQAPPPQTGAPIPGGGTGGAGAREQRKTGSGHDEVLGSVARNTVNLWPARQKKGAADDSNGNRCGRPLCLWTTPKNSAADYELDEPEAEDAEEDEPEAEDAELAAGAADPDAPASERESVR